jgi:hypothetical protein
MLGATFNAPLACKAGQQAKQPELSQKNSLSRNNGRTPSVLEVTRIVLRRQIITGDRSYTPNKVCELQVSSSVLGVIIRARRPEWASQSAATYLEKR